MYIYICICICMYMYAHVYLYMYIYIYIHMIPARGPQTMFLCNHCFEIIFAIHGSFSSLLHSHKSMAACRCWRGPGGGAPKSRVMLGAGAPRSRKGWGAVAPAADPSRTSAWTPNSVFMQPLFCNHSAIFAVQSLLCNLSYATNFEKQ